MHLGRLHAPDTRDHGYLLASHLPTIVRPSKKTWRIWWKGDQGNTSECVGYSWHGLLRAIPVLQREPLPNTIYTEAQKVDEWPGEDYEGTSVRAGAKALKARGKITAYGWAFDLDTILNWLGTKGPVVLGSYWYSTMFAPDHAGVVQVGGSIVGGHAYLAIGYNEVTQRIVCQNSWGTQWGLKGRFYLSYQDTQRLLQEDGEACTPTEG